MPDDFSPARGEVHLSAPAALRADTSLSELLDETSVWLVFSGSLLLSRRLRAVYVKTNMKTAMDQDVTVHLNGPSNEG